MHKDKKTSILGNDGEKLAGPAIVTAAHGTAPTLEFGNNATDSITIDCGMGVALDANPSNAREFWFCIPPVRQSLTRGQVMSRTGLLISRSARRLP